MTSRKNIVIVGGGITGLTAAYYLQKQVKARHLPYDINLVEASPRLGGKIQTYRKDGYTIERGPDSFLARKKPAVKLAEELGITDRLVRNGTGKSYILVNDQLHPIPKGAFMGIPTHPKPFLFSGLLSSKGKLRAGLDYVLPKGEQVTDQSLGHFFRRRFGDELVENLIEPLLSGIYAGDIDDMSLMATFPNFYKLEQTYGSLIKGLQETMPKQKPKQQKKAPGMFYSFKGGLEVFIESLVEHLDRIKIHLHTSVDHIEKKEFGYHVLLNDGHVLKADTILMATPHMTVPQILSQYDFFDVFKDVPATSVANVALAFDQSAITRELNGTGFVVSRNSDFRITACTWTHRKWPLSTPDGKVLLRCYVGKPKDQDVVQLSDEDIVKIALDDLNKIMKISNKPEFTVVSRWQQAMPQYTVGHLERLKSVKEQMTKHLPGIFLAGSSYEGVGIPDCIHQGEKVAEDMLRFLQV